MKAVYFCENDYEGCANVEDEVAFDVFESGFTVGANAYGAGSFSLYLLPRDHEKMVKAEHVGEVMRALEEVDPTFNKPLPGASK